MSKYGIIGLLAAKWVIIMKLLSLKMPHQAEWIIETDCSEIIAKLVMKYGRYISECKNCRQPDIKVLKHDAAGYIVTLKDSVTRTAHPLFHLNRFLFDNPTYSDSVFALHGAAVQWGEKCYVFLASTTTGKTTLTSYLTQCGFGYITDDCVLLERNSYKVYPFSTPLHLREGGLRVLDAYHALPPRLSRLAEPNGSCRYVYTPQNTVKRAIPLGEIFFLERTEAENAIFPMSATEKLAALLQAPIKVYPITAEYLRFLANLGTNRCKRLKYCDMNFVKEALLQYATDASI